MASQLRAEVATPPQHAGVHRSFTQLACKTPLPISHCHPITTNSPATWGRIRGRHSVDVALVRTDGVIYPNGHPRVPLGSRV